MYGFRFDHQADGVRFIKQRNGEELPDVAQSRLSFATWQDARDAGLAWAQSANDSRKRTVCNPTYQERRIDGVMAHLEMDPATGGTVLVEDAACSKRDELDRAALVADAAEAVERFGEDELEAYAARVRAAMTTGEAVS